MNEIWGLLSLLGVHNPECVHSSIGYADDLEIAIECVADYYDSEVYTVDAVLEEVRQIGTRD